MGSAMGITPSKPRYGPALWVALWGKGPQWAGL